ncbi:MAG: hypothetical protein H0T85_10450 [Geodermatophilaceae bacterium]|nr:hypothetical protein [Geodermatophilaceae bacterium]
MSVLPRVLGAATAAYGLKEILQPGHLARAADLGDPDHRGVKVLGAVLGIRDVACGVAMMTLPAGPALRTAIVARSTFDVEDCVAFSLHTPASARPKVAAITLGWAALCGLSLRWAGRA